MNALRKVAKRTQWIFFDFLVISMLFSPLLVFLGVAALPMNCLIILLVLIAAELLMGLLGFTALLSWSGFFYSARSLPSLEITLKRVLAIRGRSRSVRLVMMVSPEKNFFVARSFFWGDALFLSETFLQTLSESDTQKMLDRAIDILESDACAIHTESAIRLCFLWWFLGGYSSRSRPFIHSLFSQDSISRVSAVLTPGVVVAFGLSRVLSLKNTQNRSSFCDALFCGVQQRLGNPGLLELYSLVSEYQGESYDSDFAEN